MSTAPWSLRAAVILGERLVRQAVHHEDRCTWLTYDVDEQGRVPVVVEASCGPDLYAGTAGIGWCLARLAGVTQDASMAATAIAALRFSVRAAPHDLSLHAGRAGIAWAALDAGRALGSEELVNAGRQLMSDVAQEVLERAPAMTGWDLLGGVAGVCLALAAAAGHDDVSIEAAVAGADDLMARAQPAGAGRAWATPDRDEAPLCGLAHGASGAAVALAAVGSVARTDAYDGAVSAALRYEREVFRPLSGWPDLRNMSRLALLSGESPVYPVQWCHGAVGVTIARSRLARSRGDVDLRLVTECAAGLDVTTASTLRQLAHAPQRLDLSVCHGVAGAVEAQLEAFGLDGDREHLDHAERLLLRGIGVPPDQHRVWRGGQVSDAEVRAALAGLPCGIPGAPEVPGLMVGLAGLVAVLLRLPDPSAAPAPGLPDVVAA